MEDENNVLEFVDRKSFEERKVLKRLRARLAATPQLQSENLFPVEELSYADRQAKVEEERKRHKEDLRNQFKKK